MVSPQPATYLTGPSALDDFFSVLIPSGLKKKPASTYEESQMRLVLKVPIFSPPGNVIVPVLGLKSRCRPYLRCERLVTM